MVYSDPGKVDQLRALDWQTSARAIPHMSWSETQNSLSDERFRLVSNRYRSVQDEMNEMEPVIMGMITIAEVCGSRSDTGWLASWVGDVVTAVSANGENDGLVDT